MPGRRQTVREDDAISHDVRFPVEYDHSQGVQGLLFDIRQLNSLADKRQKQDRV